MIIIMQVFQNNPCTIPHDDLYHDNNGHITLYVQSILDEYLYHDNNGHITLCVQSVLDKTSTIITTVT